jgi:hypothetical protein
VVVLRRVLGMLVVVRRVCVLVGGIGLRRLAVMGARKPQPTTAKGGEEEHPQRERCGDAQSRTGSHLGSVGWGRARREWKATWVDRLGALAGGAEKRGAV